MAFQCRVETITVKKAEELLLSSAGNRKISERAVLALAVEMDSGRWNPLASELVLDTEGHLIDGHHRCHAVKVNDKPIDMLVKRGVDPSARNVIDTGRSRSMTDLLHMYRSDTDYPGNRKACLSVCLSLLFGNSKVPPLRTLDAFEMWSKPFATGIDWAVRAHLIEGVPTIVQVRLRYAPVAGALAFAHRTNPEVIEAFYRRVALGIGLDISEPAYVLRNLAISETRDNGHTVRKLMSEKVLNAALAYIDGRTLKKLQSGDIGPKHFRRAYDIRSIDKLMRPWAEAEEAKAQGQAPLVVTVAG